MKIIIGTKKGMSQVFDTDGNVTPVTVITVGEVKVTQVKTADKDGYAATQVGYGVKKEKNVHKAQRPKGLFAKYKEFPVEGLGVGDVITLDGFTPGDLITVSAISKGKGFAGVVKRHGFHGGRRSHGQKHSEREAGSIGGGPGRAGGRVVKGMRMAGRMGGDRITIKNVKIVRVDTERGELFVKGAVPGRRGQFVEVVSQ
ncbi:MAG: 50S ribosomal protein L3 [Patescibacteria group bacterium]